MLTKEKFQFYTLRKGLVFGDYQVMYGMKANMTFKTACDSDIPIDSIA